MGRTQTDCNGGRNDTKSLPRFLIIGAGSRGNAYAKAIFESEEGIVASIAEPIISKRLSLGTKYIWKKTPKGEDAEFSDWQEFLEYEQKRRQRQAVGELTAPGFDGIFICTLDHTHKEIITRLAPLKLHIMSEKPLATSLQDCIDIYKHIRPKTGNKQDIVFSIGHVLRYSPHNMLLREMVNKNRVIGDVLSIEHTEPVGWWHFAHSYVRGNWRKESISAPSLLTKSCHDIDLVLWLLCSPNGPQSEPHLPFQVSSIGSLSVFKRSRKPRAAGNATNCLDCQHESECMYSAKKIYLEKYLRNGNASWPVKIVHPEIEDLYLIDDIHGAEAKLLNALAEDYAFNTPQVTVDSRGWYGRCVWESDNDVCDDQIVTISWKDEDSQGSNPHLAKTASIHMVANTEAQCERRGRIYGTEGEIEYDSKMIRVYNFATAQSQTYHPHQPGGSHGGGDAGLAGQFVRAVADVKNKRRSVEDAQSLYIGCSFEDIIRSHAMVFAAEEARLESKVLTWVDWWEKNVLSQI